MSHGAVTSPAHAPAPGVPAHTRCVPLHALHVHKHPPLCTPQIQAQAPAHPRMANARPYAPLRAGAAHPRSDPRRLPLPRPAWAPLLRARRPRGCRRLRSSPRRAVGTGPRARCAPPGDVKRGHAWGAAGRGSRRPMAQARCGARQRRPMGARRSEAAGRRGRGRAALRRAAKWRPRCAPSSVPAPVPAPMPRGAARSWRHSAPLWRGGGAATVSGGSPGAGAGRGALRGGGGGGHREPGVGSGRRPRSGHRHRARGTGSRPHGARSPPTPG